MEHGFVPLSIKNVSNHSEKESLIKWRNNIVLTIYPYSRIVIYGKILIVAVPPQLRLINIITETCILLINIPSI